VVIPLETGVEAPPPAERRNADVRLDDEEATLLSDVLRCMSECVAGGTPWPEFTPAELAALRRLAEVVATAGPD
jgi:hypothetical protein